MLRASLAAAVSDAVARNGWIFSEFSDPSSDSFSKKRLATNPVSFSGFTDDFWRLWRQIVLALLNKANGVFPYWGVGNSEWRIWLVIRLWTPSDRHTPASPCWLTLPHRYRRASAAALSLPSLADQRWNESVPPFRLCNCHTFCKAEYWRKVAALKRQREWGCSSLWPCMIHGLQLAGHWQTATWVMMWAQGPCFSQGYSLQFKRYMQDPWTQQQTAA